MKILLLLAGYPGTGKSYFCNIIQSKYDFFKLISPDEIKEKYWDKYGFKNLKEKEILVEKSWKKYYELLEKNMKDGCCIISDYPFSDKQKSTLENLVIKYEYKVVTVRMIGDIQKLYERQKIRDLSPSRNLGHILSSYTKSTVVENREEAEGLLSFQEFYKRCTERGYDKFELGKLIELDMSDFSKVNYSEVISEIFS